MKNYKILTSFKNLLPFTQYSYLIEGTRGNWPVTVTPHSGSFIAMSTKHDIETEVKFCISSGVCAGPNLLPYTTGFCTIEDTPFTEFRIKLDLPYSNQNIYSSPQTIYCEECSDSHSLEIKAIDNEKNIPIFIESSILELIHERNYTYKIESLGGSYPLSVRNTSGNFIADKKSSVLLHEIKFCCPSGSCSGTTFPKTYESFRADVLDHTIKYTVTDECSSKKVSQDLTIKYTKEPLNIDMPSNITLNNTTKGCGKLDVSVKNTIENHLYSYSYKISDSNWPIYLDNTSGVFVAQGSSVSIPCNVTFCPSLSLCSGVSGVFMSTKNNNSLNYYCGNNYYANIYLEISSNCYSKTQIFTSKPTRVYCDNCISSPAISAK